LLVAAGSSLVSSSHHRRFSNDIKSSTMKTALFLSTLFVGAQSFGEFLETQADGRKRFDFARLHFDPKPFAL
jgi:hypothetical protein